MNEQITDNYLVYLWKENSSKEAIEILWKKHFKYWEKIIIKFFYSKNIISMIEKDDLFAILNKSFIDISSSYDYSQNKIIYIQYIIVQGKQLVCNLIKQIKTKKNYVLNESISYSRNNYLESKINNDSEICNPEDYVYLKYDYEFKINWINDFLKNYNEKTKEMFWLYFYGEKKGNLANKFSLTEVELRNKLFYIIRKMRNAYTNFNLIHNR